MSNKVIVPCGRPDGRRALGRLATRTLEWCWRLRVEIRRGRPTRPTSKPSEASPERTGKPEGDNVKDEAINDSNIEMIYWLLDYMHLRWLADCEWLLFNDGLNWSDCWNWSSILYAPKMDIWLLSIDFCSMIDLINLILLLIYATFIPDCYWLIDW